MRVVVLSRWGLLLVGVYLAILTLGVGLLFPWPLVRRAAGDLAVAVSSARRRIPIYSVGITDKRVAISFDAAWGAEYTPRILDILRRHKVKTTFFLVGFWIERYPEVVKQIAAEGHEIGNHTNTHPHLNSLSREEIKTELSEVHRRIKELTGQEARLFRPPFGEYSNRVIEAAEELGYTTIQWSVDSLDWQDLTSDAILRKVTGEIHPGAIVLFHNNARYTPDALEPIIQHLHGEGYTIVPISELLFKGPYYVDHQGVQRAGNAPAAPESAAY